MSDAEKDDWDEDSPWMKEEGGGRYEDTTEDFTVEPARSSRSTCQRCRNKIEKVGVLISLPFLLGCHFFLLTVGSFTLSAGSFKDRA